MQMTEKKVVGILFSIWCIILPWSIVGMQILAGVLVIVSIGFAIRNKRMPVQFHKFFIFCGFYIFSLIITILAVPDSYHVLRSTFNNDWMLILVPFLIFLNLTEEWRRRAIYALIVSSGVAGLYGIIQFFVGIEYFRGKNLGLLGNYYRAIGGYGGFFEFAGNQLMTFGIAVALVLKDSKKRILIIFPVIAFLAIIASQTRSAWIAALFIIFLAFLITNRKYLAYAIIAVFLISLFIFVAVPDVQSRFESIFDPAKNEGRLNIWRTSFEIFKENMIVGVGHGNFDKFFDVNRVPGFYDAQGHAHNDYLNIAVLNGIVGLAAWLGMWIFWFLRSFRVYRLQKLKQFDRTLILGGIFSISGILFASFFECYYTDLENNIFWWFIICLNLIIIRGTNNNQPGNARSHQ
jgi:O-antigen ligase